MMVAAICFIVAVAVNAQNGAPAAKQAAPAAAPAAQTVSANQAVVQKYCASCHNEKLKSGGLALTALDLTNVPKNTDRGNTSSGRFEPAQCRQSDARDPRRLLPRAS